MIIKRIFLSVASLVDALWERVIVGMEFEI